MYLIVEAADPVNNRIRRAAFSHVLISFLKEIIAFLVLNPKNSKNQSPAILMEKRLPALVKTWNSIVALTNYFDTCIHE